jgi:adenine-specific DNA-methyltransferase
MKKVKRLSVSGVGDTANQLIQGDNLNVLQLLSDSYKEDIRCIYIDPPYNNGELYHHYDDRYDEDWLSGLCERISLMKGLLSKDGSIWISIDDSEIHYLKVEMDRIFGRSNYVATINWQQRTTRENRAVFSKDVEYILVYAKDKAKFSKSRNKLDGKESLKDRFKNPDLDPRGVWQSVSLNVQAGHAVSSQFYNIVAPNGKLHYPPSGRCWAYNLEKVNRLIKDKRIWFGKDGNGVPRLKKFLSESNLNLTPSTLWSGAEVGTNKSAKKQFLKEFPNSDIFDTPKPEGLIERILEIATNKNDLVLDAYLGSGTTAVVAHRMNRNFIGIELGNQIREFAVERLKNQIEDSCGNKNQSGFNFYKWSKKKMPQ